MAEGDPVYVILGGTGGIGRALCARLAGSGANLVVGGRDEGRLGELADEHGAHTVVLEAREGAEVEALFREAKDRLGRVDGAVNLVGSFMLKPAHLTKDAEWAETISLNATTAFNTVRAAARHMPEGGSVVLMSSVAARVGLANHEAVAAAKAAVIGLSQSAAASYVSRGLRFNAVAPGLVRTPLTENVTRSETARNASIALHPMGRLGEPEDIAGIVAWLLDGEASSWVTGQTFGVDGGLSTLHPLPRRPGKDG